MQPFLWKTSSFNSCKEKRNKRKIGKQHQPTPRLGEQEVGGTGPGGAGPGGDPSKGGNQDEEVAELEVPRDKEAVIADSRKAFCKEVMPRYFQNGGEAKDQGTVCYFLRKISLLARSGEILAFEAWLRTLRHQLLRRSAVIPYNAGAMSHVQTNATPLL